MYHLRWILFLVFSVVSRCYLASFYGVFFNTNSGSYLGVCSAVLPSFQPL